MLTGCLWYACICGSACVAWAHVVQRSQRKEKGILSHEPKVDIVIPASCQKDASILASSESAMIQRDRDNDELTYTLRSIAKNAPWAHKVFVLQNPECEDVWKNKTVAEPDKTVWVDRCALLPPESCPTRNSCVVQSIFHRIPDLSEHFIYTDDDNLLIKPTTISTFFRNLEGAWLPKVPKYHGAQAIYSNITGVPVQKVPMHVRTFSHCWQPLLKSAVTAFENSYGEFVNFVRSHPTGRYSSKLNQYGTTESERANSLEEDFQRIWWWWLHEKHLGSEVLDNDVIEIGLFLDGPISNWTRWYSMFNETARMILNINDDLDARASVYKRQHKDAIDKLEYAFPAARQQRVMRRSEPASSLLKADLVKKVAPSPKWAILESAFPAPSTKNLIYRFWRGREVRRWQLDQGGSVQTIIGNRVAGTT